MRRRKFLWKLLPPFLLLLGGSLFFVSWYVLTDFKTFYLRQISSSMTQKIRVIETQVKQNASAGNIGELERVCRLSAEKFLVRLSLLFPDGKIVCGEEKDAVDGRGMRFPEILQAFRGDVGVATRYDGLVQADAMSLTVPVMESNQVVLVIRAVFPVASFDASFNAIVMRVFMFAVGVFGMVILAGYIVARRVTEPVHEARLGAERFARGEFDKPILTDATVEEVDALVNALNTMAAQLDERIQRISGKCNRYEAVLSSMEEGVIALDREGCLLNINEAASRMLRIYQKNVEGKSLQEVVRNSALHEFAVRAFASEVPLEEDIQWHGGETRFIHISSTGLIGANGEKIGLLIVLHDVTRLKKLESVRRDFVANVSHELKTPLTSIKGFVESLLDGAANDPADARNFLEIIHKQTDRLNEIIEDLLMLSKIEKDTTENEVSLEKMQVNDIVTSAIDICRSKWTDRREDIHFQCEDGLQAVLNRGLIEQALVNLIDNAVKYSEKGVAVQVNALRKSREVLIQVIDKGQGIAEEHIPRLFERFYRIDQARSREVGGSGLGLAIVKHITQAHGGYVTVRSVVGQGSEFSLHLPAPVSVCAS